VSKRLPNREQAIKLLIENNCPPTVINHCQVVADFASEIAHKMRARGLQVNLELVEAGAILHDIGRSKTHKIDHSLVGSQIAKKLGLPQEVVDIVKRHAGAGITDQEAAWLGWPKDVYIPQTWEEKIVCYADKRIDHGKVVPIENEIDRLRDKGLVEAAERVRKLHNDITDLLGETP
jgi:uncharacterized protein